MGLIPGFVKEFVGNWILNSMEDPEERDQKWRQHMQEVLAKCERNKQMWNQPTKAFGYWNKDKNNAHFLLDLKQSHYLGRIDPYDAVKSDPYANVPIPHHKP